MSDIEKKKQCSQCESKPSTAEEPKYTKKVKSTVHMVYSQRLGKLYKWNICQFSMVSPLSVARAANVAIARPSQMLFTQTALLLSDRPSESTPLKVIEKEASSFSFADWAGAPAVSCAVVAPAAL